MEQSLDKQLPFSDDFKIKSGWAKTWGVISWQNGFLKLGAHATTTGASAFLDGSYLWQDYDFKVKANLVSGRTFSLLARYQENDFYLSCNFSQNRATLQERIDGQERIVAQWNRKEGNFWEQGKDTNIGMQVIGQRARCLVDGWVVLTSPRIGPELTHGGIGFKVWGQEPGTAELIIKNVVVDAITE